MDNYMVTPGNAWELDMFDGEIVAGKKGRERRDEYFDRTDDGHYKLKDGYEQRYLGGSGDSLGAEMTYTTDWDDDNKEKQHYGIYKTSQPKSNNESTPTPAAEPAPAPKPAAEKSEPVGYSPQMQEAKERVNTYKDNVASSASTDSIFSSTKPDEATESFLNNKKYQFKAQ